MQVIGHIATAQRLSSYAHFIFRWSPGKPGHFTKVKTQGGIPWNSSWSFPSYAKMFFEELPRGGLYFDQKWTPPAFRLTLDPTAKLLSFQLIFQLVNCWKMSQTLVGKWDRIMRFHCWIDHPMILLWRKMMLFTLIFREFLFRRLWEWEMETERLYDCHRITFYASDWEQLCGGA